MNLDESKIANIQVDIRRGRTSPRRGQVFRHYKGGIYVVLGLALLEEDGEVMVWYKSLENGYHWCRPLFEWYSLIEGHKDQHRRFAYLGFTLDLGGQ